MRELLRGVDRLCDRLMLWNGHDSNVSPALPPFSLSHWMWLRAGCWPPCDLQPEPSLISSVTSTFCGVARGQRISSGVSRPTTLSPGFMWKDEPHPSPFFKILWCFFWSWEILWAANWQLWDVVQNLRREKSNKACHRGILLLIYFPVKHKIDRRKVWKVLLFYLEQTSSYTNPELTYSLLETPLPLVHWHSEP